MTTHGSHKMRTLDCSGVILVEGDDLGCNAGQCKEQQNWIQQEADNFFKEYNLK